MPSPSIGPSSPSPAFHACVVGLGNIGSQLVPLLARSGAFGSLTLVDPDVYDQGNLRTQSIGPAHVGMRKAEAQALVARTIDPNLRATPVCAAVEDVPLGRLRADVIFSAPDTRRARQHVNRIAWRLGVTAWIDTGIDPAAQLVRVSLFSPRDDGPCLECAWGPDDYALLGEHVSCTDASRFLARSTNGPPALGALAAARAALLCEHLLCERGGHVRAGTQITLAVREHRLAVTSFRRNPACRFDHDPLPVSALRTAPLTTRLHDIDTWNPGTDGNPCWRLAVDGCDIAARVSCEACGRVREGLRLLRPASGAGLRCDCGARLVAAPFDSVSQVDRVRLTQRQLGLTLGDLGLQAADILTLGDGARVRSVEIAGEAPPPGRRDTPGRGEGAEGASCDHASAVRRAVPSLPA